MLKIYNTLSRSVEEFLTLKNDKNVGMYACGPTVYGYAHIGHGRKYVGDDIIKRSLQYLGYKVKHVMNITDVGHLVSDGDIGEDKMEKGAKQHKKTVWELAEYFTNQFFLTTDDLNIIRPNVVCKASEHIPQQIEMIKKLIQKGFAYKTSTAIYYDTSKFKDYGKLSGQKTSDKEVGVRDEVEVDPEKENPADFVLWFFTVGKYKNHTMRWESPFGTGFPGWHIECSAMSVNYLGDSFEIHTGGVDHIPVHHENEIAQSEAATGVQPFVKYWVHHEFIKVDGVKMSKSLGNLYTLRDIVEKGFTPIHLRFYFLTAHYRTPQNFTWKGLESAKSAFVKLVNHLREYKKFNNFVINKKNTENFRSKFIQAVEDDFNMPKALSVLWEVVSSGINPSEKYSLIIEFDQVFGLGLKELAEKTEEFQSLPEEVQYLIKQREEARKNKDWQKSDEIRDTLEKNFGYKVRDLKSS